MKAKLFSIAMAMLVAGNIFATPAESKGSAPAASASKFPKVMTGFETKMSVQILRVVRAHVPGFGQNGVVVVQYRLRKEGPNPPGNTPFEKDKWWPSDIKARDPVMSQAFNVWQRTDTEQTYSDACWTSDWKVGQQGDGYVWLNVPERIKVIDIYFPYTNPQRVQIEVPKA
jgi:hypothetical protein